jgi:hypothetical protein
VKQKTAVPQGAASLSLAVLESDGRKKEEAIATVREGVGRRGVETAQDETAFAVPRQPD